MIGDTTDYIKLVAMVKSQKALEISPGELIVGSKGDDSDGDGLADDTQSVPATTSPRRPS